MKATELRIKNWYQSVKFGIPVQCELSDLYDLCAKSDGAYNEPPIEEMFEPIPLTEKWLLKFGFNKWNGWLCKDAFSPGHPSQRFDLYWSEKDGFMTKSRYQEDNEAFAMRHIKYVHQLQNLFHALTGEELTIKELKTS